MTATEIFPLEMCSLAIAVLYVAGTLAPSMFGRLIGTGQPWMADGGLLTMIGAATEVVLGIVAEGKSLESVADPRSS